MNAKRTRFINPFEPLGDDYDVPLSLDSLLPDKVPTNKTPSLADTLGVKKFSKYRPRRRITVKHDSDYDEDYDEGYDYDDYSYDYYDDLDFKRAMR